MEAVNTTRIYAVVFFLLAALGIGFLCYGVLSPLLARIAWVLLLGGALAAGTAASDRPQPIALDVRLPGACPCGGSYA